MSDNEGKSRYYKWVVYYYYLYNLESELQTTFYYYPKMINLLLLLQNLFEQMTNSDDALTLKKTLGICPGLFVCVDLLLCVAEWSTRSRIGFLSSKVNSGPFESWWDWVVVSEPKPSNLGMHFYPRTPTLPALLI